MKTFQGNPITFTNEQLNKGDKALDFKTVNGSLKDVHLNEFSNEYIILNVIPSLDSAVCDLQTKTINEEIMRNESLDIKVITISNDLPFAQNRWKNEEELEGITILSDYLYHDFGKKFGLLINENKLLARAIYILNQKREIIYMIDVNEQTQHIDYDSLFDYINELPGS